MKDAGLRFLMLLVAITSPHVFVFGQEKSTGSLELRVELLNALNNINFLVGGTAAVDDGKLTATNLGLQTPNYSAATLVG